MSESYMGKQIVGMDLHRRRSVLVRTTELLSHAWLSHDLRRQ